MIIRKEHNSYITVDFEKPDIPLIINFLSLGVNNFQLTPEDRRKVLNFLDSLNIFMNK